MHSEYLEVSQETARSLNDVRKDGGRIVAVGTTVVRALETASPSPGKIEPYSGFTDIFIYPGYSFKAVDAMITNFHLPRSTLLMMICAFGGYDNIMELYRHAVKERYRFFSFGDAMLLL